MPVDGGDGRVRSGRYLGKLDASKKARFLAYLAEGLSIARAARAVGLSDETFRLLRRRDPAFADAFAEAYRCGTDALEEAARRRAVEGVTRAVPIVYQGQQVGVRTEVAYSDVLLMFLLKARDPARFRDRSERAGAATPAVDPREVARLAMRSTAELEALLLRQRRARRA